MLFYYLLKFYSIDISLWNSMRMLYFTCSKNIKICFNSYKHLDQRYLFHYNDTTDTAVVILDYFKIQKTSSQFRNLNLILLYSINLSFAILKSFTYSCIDWLMFLLIYKYTNYWIGKKKLFEILLKIIIIK